MKFDNRYDIVSGADSKGDVVYIDRRIPRYSRRLKTKDGKPADLWKYLGTHELWEEEAMDHGFIYRRAHTNIATPMERKAVEADGVSWKAYSEVIDGYLDHIEHEKVTKPPPAHLHVDPQSAIGHHRGKHKHVKGRRGPKLDHMAHARWRSARLQRQIQHHTLTWR